MTEEVAEPVLFPNPAQDKITVSYYSNADSRCRISIADMAGRVVLKTEFSVVAGQNDLELNLSDISKGAYLLTFEMKEDKVVKKIIIE